MNITHERARIAALSRDRAPDDPELIQVRRDFYAERLAAHVAKIIAQAPPLTAAQRDRISALLRPSASSSSNA